MLSIPGSTVPPSRPAVSLPTSRGVDLSKQLPLFPSFTTRSAAYLPSPERVGFVGQRKLVFGKTQ